MEQSANSSLFSLTIDPLTKTHLGEAARWARFLAIVGMIFIVLMVVFGVVFSTLVASQFGGPVGEGRAADMFGSSFGIGMAMLYIVGALIWFFPLLYLLRFANKTKLALTGNDQQALNTAFQNLKVCYRYLGIVTIIVLALYAIVIVFGIVGAAAFA